MTIPSERTRAVNYTYEFLRDLMDPKKTPRVQKMLDVVLAVCLDIILVVWIWKWLSTKAVAVLEMIRILLGQRA